MKSYYKLLEEQMEENLNEVIDPVSGAIVIAGLGALWKLLRVSRSEAFRRCQKMATKPALSCITMAKYDLAKKEMGLLSKAKASCSKTKDPVKCSKSIEVKIKKLKYKITNLEYKVSQIKAKGKATPTVSKTSKTKAPEKRKFLSN